MCPAVALSEGTPDSAVNCRQRLRRTNEATRLVWIKLLLRDDKLSDHRSVPQSMSGVCFRFR